MDINTLISDLKETLEKEFKTNFTGLVLFGSYAKATQNKNSDVDIIITFKKLPSGRYERTNLIVDIVIELESKYHVQISPIFCEDKEFNKSVLIIEIADYGKILVDKSKIISKIFESVKKDFEKGFVKKIIKSDHHVLEFKNV